MKKNVTNLKLSFSLWALSALAITSVVGSAQWLSIHPSTQVRKSSHFCEATLARLAVSHLDHSASITMRVGFLSDLEWLLATSDIEESHRKKIIQNLQQTLESHHENSALEQTVKTLNRYQNQRDLFIGVPSVETYHSEEGMDAVMRFNPLDFDVVSELLPFPIDPALPPRKAISFLLTNSRKFQDDFDIKSWVADFFHMANRYASRLLISEWITANTELLKRGKPGDSLFTRYVSQREDQFLVHENFYQTLVEPRAFSITSYFAKKLYPQKSSETEEKIRQFVLNLLEDRSALSSSNNGAANLHNVLEIGDMIAEILESTIGKTKGID